jgi:hypothetical protein
MANMNQHEKRRARRWQGSENCLSTLYVYFAEEIIRGLQDLCYPEGRNPHQWKVAFHFDNFSIHSTRTIMGQSEFKRIECPPDGRDFAPCDFFLLVT